MKLNPHHLSEEEIEVVWAALCSMVLDIHQPEDHLSEDKWKVAESLFQRLDEYMNEKAK